MYVTEDHQFKCSDKKLSTIAISIRCVL